MAAPSKKSASKGGIGSPVLSFEEKMKRLDEIVRAMEQGDRPLEESLALFEEGMKLSSECQTLLEKAERKVTMLLSGTSAREAGARGGAGDAEDDTLQEVPFQKE